MVKICALFLQRSLKSALYYFLHLQLLLFRSFPLSLAQGDNGAQTEIPAPPPRKEAIDFGKLELNQDSLRGSRWAKEYNGDIKVYHSIEIVDIVRVDVDTMSLRIELHMRQRWFVNDLHLPKGLFMDNETDSSFVIAEQTVLDSVWSPDSYFPNARETKIASVSSQQSLVKIYKNKTITFASRISTTLGCSFAFQWYPVDTQSCELVVESYTFPSTKVIYLWEDPKETSPLTVGNMKLLQYELKQPLKYYNDTSTRFGRTERYAQVVVRFTFERKIGQYIIQTTVPTVLIVVLSWFSFWLGLDAVPGRISLVITCMLSLVTMHNSQKKDLPPVNYVKMSDIWMVGCMAFVFTAFCEFIIVKYLQWMDQEKAKKKNEVMPIHDPPPAYPLPPGNRIVTDRRRLLSPEPYVQFFEKNPNNGQPQRRIVDNSVRFNSENYWERNNDGPHHRQEDARRQNIKRKKRSPIWTTVDMISRFAFPFFFVVFCATYWPLLFLGADENAKTHL